MWVYRDGGREIEAGGTYTKNIKGYFYWVVGSFDINFFFSLYAHYNALIMKYFDF